MRPRARRTVGGAAALLVVALGVGAVLRSREGQPTYPGQEHDLADTTDRDDFMKQVERLVREGRTAELEALADRARAEHQRFDDGTFRLGELYATIQGLGHRLDESRAAEVRAALERWRAERPDSPTAHVVLASFVLGTAFQARGGKAAGDVPDSAWSAFEERVSRARGILESAPPAARSCPGWHATLLDVARVDSTIGAERAASIFEAGVALDPSYQPLYFSRVLGLLPRWGGSIAEINQLAERAAALTRATDGRSLYARVIWYALQNEGAKRLTDGSFEWLEFRDAFRDLVARTPRSMRNRQALARYACVAGDRATAAELMPEFGEGWYSDVWPSHLQFAACRDLARR